MVIAGIKPTLGEGISYAVSSGKIKRCVDDMINRGRYYHPALGIYAADLTPLKCYDNGFNTVQGAYVEFAAGGASIAGILQGDLIISVNGLAIRDVGELASVTCEHVRYGQYVKIRVVRAGKEIEFEFLPGYRAESMSEVTGTIIQSSTDAPDLPFI
jgi:S1-C subfamily serine protease